MDAVDRDVSHLVHPDVMIQIKRDFEAAATRKGDTTLSRNEFVAAMIKHIPRDGQERAVIGTVAGDSSLDLSLTSDSKSFITTKLSPEDGMLVPGSHR